MVSDEMFMVGTSLIANQRDMERRHQWEMDQVEEALVQIDKVLNDQDATIDELRKQLREVRNELATGVSFIESLLEKQGKAKQLILDGAKERATLKREVETLQSQNKSLTHSGQMNMVFAAVQIGRATAYSQQVDALLKEHPDTPLSDAAGNDEGRTPLQVLFDRAYSGQITGMNITNDLLDQASAYFKMPLPRPGELNISEGGARAAPGPTP